MALASFQVKSLVVKWLDPTVSVCLTFKVSARLFSKVVQLHIPTDREGELRYILAYAWSCRLYSLSHSNWYVLLAHCGFNLHFPKD